MSCTGQRNRRRASGTLSGNLGASIIAEGGAVGTLANIRQWDSLRQIVELHPRFGRAGDTLRGPLPRLAASSTRHWRPLVRGSAKQQREVLGGQGVTEQKALSLVAMLGLQERELLLRFDALGNDPLPERL